MIEKSVVVSLVTGLQARPAAQFVERANRFSAQLFLEKDGRRVNAKSIMGMMSLAVGTGETITLIADGEGEQQAIDALIDFVSASSHAS